MDFYIYLRASVIKDVILFVERNGFNYSVEENYDGDIYVCVQADSLKSQVQLVRYIAEKRLYTEIQHKAV